MWIDASVAVMQSRIRDRLAQSHIARRPLARRSLFSGQTHRLSIDAGRSSMSTSTVTSKRDNWITVILGAEAEERSALAWSFLCFFCLLLGYYILRSVREAMIAADGRHLVPTVFTSVFFCMLALTPVYGAIVSRFPRRRFLPIV